MTKTKAKEKAKPKAKAKPREFKPNIPLLLTAQSRQLTDIAGDISEAHNRLGTILERIAAHYTGEQTSIAARLVERTEALGRLDQNANYLYNFLLSFCDQHSISPYVSGGINIVHSCEVLARTIAAWTEKKLAAPAPERIEPASANVLNARLRDWCTQYDIPLSLSNSLNSHEQNEIICAVVFGWIEERQKLWAEMAADEDTHDK